MINCISNWWVELRVEEVGGKDKDWTGVEIKMIFKDMPGKCKWKKPGSMVGISGKGELKPKIIQWEKASPIMTEDIKHSDNMCHDTLRSR